MTTNQSSHSPQPHFHSTSGSKPKAIEQTLKTSRIQIERKTFVFTLKENKRGCFLRIAEETKYRWNAIMIPATGLDEFKRLLEDTVRGIAAGQT